MEKFTPLSYEIVAHMRASDTLAHPEIAMLITEIEKLPELEALKSFADEDNKARIAYGGHINALWTDTYSLIDTNDLPGRLKNLPKTKQKKAESIHRSILKRFGLVKSDPFTPFPNYLLNGGGRCLEK